MLQFFIFYLTVGFFISLVINIGCWISQKPGLTAFETIVTFILWPTVIASFINSLNNYEEDIEE